MMKKGLFSADGLAHTRPMEGERAKKHYGNAGIFEEKRRLEAEVCVDCDFPTCSGTIECMRKRKKKLEESKK